MREYQVSYSRPMRSHGTRSGLARPTADGKKGHVRLAWRASVPTALAAMIHSRLCRAGIYLSSERAPRPAFCLSPNGPRTLKLTQREQKQIGLLRGFAA